MVFDTGFITLAERNPQNQYFGKVLNNRIVKRKTRWEYSSKPVTEVTAIFSAETSRTDCVVCYHFSSGTEQKNGDHLNSQIKEPVKSYNEINHEDEATNNEKKQLNEMKQYNEMKEHNEMMKQHK